MTSEVLGDKDDVICKIKEQIKFGKVLNYQPPLINEWITTTTKILEREFSDNRLAQKFQLISFSRRETDVINKSIQFLESLVTDIENGLHDHVQLLEKSNSEIDQKHAMIIIRKFLKNFLLHIREMYQVPVHGNGHIKQDDLKKIKIGNEYDVQRILYSILKPIFPEARLEVSEDDGYGTVRYDIFLNNYSMVIEVKCTRPSLTEKKLKEELGSDIYHYKQKYIFFFIYDKEEKIKNKEAFVEAYTSDDKEIGKQIETYIVQQIIL